MSESESGVHPLLLPNILNNIFHYSTTEELETLRLVNWDWDSAACIAIANKKSVTFNLVQDLQSYISLFSQSNSSLHSTFNLHFKISTEEESEISKQLQSFLNNFANSIRSLTITLGSCFFGLEHLKFFLKNLPHLESLGIQLNYFTCSELIENNSTFPKNLILKSLKTLIVSRGSYDSSWESASKLLALLFQCAPNLSKIGHPSFCIPPTKCRIPSMQNIFLTESILLETEPENSSGNTLSKLSTLEFIAKLNEDNIKVLLDRKFPLKHLFTNLWYPDDEELCVTSLSLKLLMSLLSSSLEKLGLDFPWRREVAYEFFFPIPMKRLTYLSLNGYQGSLLRLLDNLPQLRSIELSQVDLLEILPKAGETDFYTQVAKLRLDFCMNQLPGLISRLSRIFPNLKSLNVNHTTNDIARMVFKKMQSLTHLRFHGDDFTDEGLTGIPSDVAKENHLLSCSTVKGNSLRNYPFIGDLPNLTHLKLEAYQLTEACIQHGIVHCTSLHFVSMDTRLENDASETVTRTFRLADYGKRLPGGPEGTLILREEIPTEEDENCEIFFKMYEQGMATDLLFV